MNFASVYPRINQAALALLHKHLTPKQQRQLVVRHFITITCTSIRFKNPRDHHYHVYAEGYVEQYSGSECVPGELHERGFCIDIPNTSLPAPDKFLAAKWMLEAREGWFRAVAGMR